MSFGHLSWSQNQSRGSYQSKFLFAAGSFFLSAFRLKCLGRGPCESGSRCRSIGSFQGKPGYAARNGCSCSTGGSVEGVLRLDAPAAQQDSCCAWRSGSRLNRLYLLLLKLLLQLRFPPFDCSFHLCIASGNPDAEHHFLYEHALLLSMPRSVADFIVHWSPYRSLLRPMSPFCLPPGCLPLFFLPLCMPRDSPL